MTIFWRYLIVEAVADLIYSTIVFINYLIIFNDANLDLSQLSWVLCQFTEFVLNIIDSYCIFLTLTLSFDRLYAILKPLKIKLLFTYLHPKRTATIGFFTLLVVKLPELFFSQVEYKDINKGYIRTHSSHLITYNRLILILFYF